MPETNEAGNQPDAKGYWAAVIKLTITLLLIWFAVSFGAGILLVDILNQVSLGGAPLGFWFAQQGSIYVFVAVIAYYCFAMARIGKKFGVEG